MFKNISKSEFESQQQAKALRGFTADIASKICAISRGHLGIPMIQVGEIESKLYKAKDYIASQSATMKDKIGVQFDESSFIALAINADFLSKCSYFWAGGRLEAPKAVSGKMPTNCEVAFLNQFLNLVTPMFDEELNKITTEQTETHKIDDKGVVFKNEQCVQINTVKLSFNGEMVEVSIVSSDGVLKYCDLANSEKGQSEKTVAISNLTVPLKVCFEPIQMKISEIEQLAAGQMIQINDPSVCLINSSNGKVIANGLIGNDENGQELLQII